MIGYSGVEHLVFGVISRTLSQADLDITVKLDEASAYTKSADVYDLNVARTRSDGIQNARAHLRRIMEETLKGSEMSEEGMVLTSLTCPVLLRIQPFFDAALPDDQEDLFVRDNEKVGEAEKQNKQHLHFLVWWADPKHNLSHVTSSQGIPSWWCTYALSNNSVCPSRTKSVGGTSFE